MIQAYSKMQQSQQSILLFRQMLIADIPLDDYTFTFVITSCSHQNTSAYGEVVNGLSIKCAFESTLFVGNALINMYSVFAQLEDAYKVFIQMSDRDIFTWTSLLCGFTKYGNMGKACNLFALMPLRNIVSWTVMISGFIGSGSYIEALDCFQELLSEDKLKPNEAIIVCALSACAHLGALDQGNWINVYIGKNRIAKSSNISTALIDMYSKCGKIDCGKEVFDAISAKNVQNFTSMIFGFSIHGLGRDALSVFSQMLADKVMPNDVTILAVLNGCSHSGLVEEGSEIFNDMENLWGIMPKIEHYGSYIDLLGRSGFLKHAIEVAKSMPMKPDIVIWRALLNACKIHGDVDHGEYIIGRIWELNSVNQNGGQVLLSNLYASLGKWDRVDEVRKLMVERRVKSTPGCSFIEVNGVIHEFLVDDQIHPQIKEIKESLNEILRRAKLGGYVPKTTEISFNLTEEEKVEAVALHSEKLAVAFGFMSTGSGTSIRIVKNLRTCEDCHMAMKAISLVFAREIIVRDRSRFHTFQEGKCSCNDFW